MNSNPNWVLEVDPAVYKFLARVPHHDAEQIFQVLKALPVSPFEGDIQKMKGQENIWRRRVGSYRLFYKLIIAERAIHVFRVERRTSHTY